MTKHAQRVSAWNTWWHRTCPPHALAIVRICLGLFLLIYASTYFCHIPLLFSSEGMVMPLLADMQSGVPDWIIYPPSAFIAYLLVGVLTIALVFYTLGLHFRIASMVIILLGVYYWQLSLHLFATSYNRLLFLTIIVLLFSGADKTLSLHMKWKKGSWLAWESVSIFPARLLALQVSATYLGVGLQKYIIAQWQSGEILHYSMLGMWASPLSYWLMQWQPAMLLFDVLVLVTLLFETLLPFGLWHTKTQKWWMFGGVIFHFLIAILLSIWWFIALYPLYLLFFKPEEVQKWIMKRCA